MVSVSMTAICIWLGDQLPHLLCSPHDVRCREQGGVLKGFWRFSLFLVEALSFLEEGLGSNQALICYIRVIIPTGASVNLFSQNKTPQHSLFVLAN